MWMNAETKGLNYDIVEYDAKELDQWISRFFSEIRKSNDLKILSLNYFMLFAFNGLNLFSQITVNLFFFIDIKRLGHKLILTPPGAKFQH